jgi:DegV family protein with EDD domain
MKNYVLTCSSTVDLSTEYLKALNINYIEFNYQINNDVYKDDMGKTISSKEFYDLMRNGATTKTSQINVNDYIEFFKSFLENNYDVLHVELSSGLSGSYNSAMLAKGILEEDYPNNKIIIIDSLAASAGYGLLMTYAAKFKDSGYSIDELSNWIENNKLNLHHWFYSTDLSYYVKGGRITQTAGFVGSLLNLCPLLNVDSRGKLIPRHKVVGKKRVMKRIVNQMKEFATDKLEYNGKCFISHADILEDAKEVARRIEEDFPNLDGNVEIFNIGTTIGSHTGPGTLAVFFMGDERND